MIEHIRNLPALIEHNKNKQTLFNYWTLLYYNKYLYYFFNFFLKKGKKMISIRLIYQLLQKIKQYTTLPPILVLQSALLNYRHLLKLRILRYRRKSIYKYVFLSPEKQVKLSINYLSKRFSQFNSASSKSNLIEKLSIFILNLFFKTSLVYGRFLSTTVHMFSLINENKNTKKRRRKKVRRRKKRKIKARSTKLRVKKRKMLRKIQKKRRFSRHKKRVIFTLKRRIPKRRKKRLKKKGLIRIKRKVTSYYYHNVHYKKLQKTRARIRLRSKKMFMHILRSPILSWYKWYLKSFKNKLVFHKANSHLVNSTINNLSNNPVNNKVKVARISGSNVPVVQAMINSISTLSNNFTMDPHTAEKKVLSYIIQSKLKKVFNYKNDISLSNSRFNIINKELFTSLFLIFIYKKHFNKLRDGNLSTLLSKIHSSKRIFRIVLKQFHYYLSRLKFLHFYLSFFQLRKEYMKRKIVIMYRLNLMAKLMKLLKTGHGNGALINSLTNSLGSTLTSPSDLVLALKKLKTYYKQIQQRVRFLCTKFNTIYVKEKGKSKRGSSSALKINKLFHKYNKHSKKLNIYLTRVRSGLRINRININRWNLRRHYRYLLLCAKLKKNRQLLKHTSLSAAPLAKIRFATSGRIVTNTRLSHLLKKPLAYYSILDSYQSFGTKDYSNGFFHIQKRRNSLTGVSFIGKRKKKVKIAKRLGNRNSLILSIVATFNSIQLYCKDKLRSFRSLGISIMNNNLKSVKKTISTLNKDLRLKYLTRVIELASKKKNKKIRRGKLGLASNAAMPSTFQGTNISASDTKVNRLKPSERTSDITKSDSNVKRTHRMYETKSETKSHTSRKAHGAQPFPFDFNVDWDRLFGPFSSTTDTEPANIVEADFKEIPTSNNKNKALQLKSHVAGHAKGVAKEKIKYIVTDKVNDKVNNNANDVSHTSAVNEMPGYKHDKKFDRNLNNNSRGDSSTLRTNSNRTKKPKFIFSDGMKYHTYRHPDKRPRSLRKALRDASRNNNYIKNNWKNKTPGFDLNQKLSNSRNHEFNRRFDQRFNYPQQTNLQFNLSSPRNSYVGGSTHSSKLSHTYFPSRNTLNAKPTASYKTPNSKSAKYRGLSQGSRSNTDVIKQINSINAQINNYFKKSERLEKERAKSRKLLKFKKKTKLTKKDKVANILKHSKSRRVIRSNNYLFKLKHMTHRGLLLGLYLSRHERNTVGRKMKKIPFTITNASKSISRNAVDHSNILFDYLNANNAHLLMVKDKIKHLVDRINYRLEIRNKLKLKYKRTTLPVSIRVVKNKLRERYRKIFKTAAIKKALKNKKTYLSDFDYILGLYELYHDYTSRYKPMVIDIIKTNKAPVRSANTTKFFKKLLLRIVLRKIYRLLEIVYRSSTKPFWNMYLVRNRVLSSFFSIAAEENKKQSSVEDTFLSNLIYYINLNMSNANKAAELNTINPAHFTSLSTIKLYNKRRLYKDVILGNRSGSIPTISLSEVSNLGADNSTESHISTKEFDYNYYLDKVDLHSTLKAGRNRKVHSRRSSLNKRISYLKKIQSASSASAVKTISLSKKRFVDLLQRYYILRNIRLRKANRNIFLRVLRTLKRCYYNLIRYKLIRLVWFALNFYSRRKTTFNRLHHGRRLLTAERAFLRKN